MRIIMGAWHPLYVHLEPEILAPTFADIPEQE